MYNQKPRMAKAAFDTAMKLWPQFPAASMALLKLHMQEQAFSEAIAAGKKVLQLQPNNVEAHILLGKAYIGTKDLGQVITTFQTALQLDPKRVTTYLSLADLYRRTKNPGAAEKMYQSALEIHPQGRSYEFGDRAKPHKVSKRPLPQARRRCPRWVQPSSLHRMPPPVKRWWLRHFPALSTIPDPSGQPRSLSRA